jgi:hypothetical protein
MGTQMFCDEKRFGVGLRFAWSHLDLVAELVTKPNEDAVIIITAVTWCLEAHCQQRVKRSP